LPSISIEWEKVLNLISCFRLRKKLISSCDVSCSNLRGTGVGSSAGFIEVGKDRGGGVQPSSDANF